MPTAARCAIISRLDNKGDVKMCGFVGFTGDPDEGVLHSMTTAIAHRGPDDARAYPWALGGCP